MSSSITPRLTFLELLRKNQPQAAAWVTGSPDAPQLSGLVKFYDTPYDGVLIEAELFGLPNIRSSGSSDFYGMHIHEYGDCSQNFTKTFFQGLPQALMESAKIDGASELQTFFKIVMPLSKPVIATISLLTLLSRWNDWNTALIYIKSSNLYSLQYLLQKILREAEFVKNMADSSPVAGMDLDLSNLPSVTIRFAMCMVAAGPMLIIFPFFQKYFDEGIMVGSVKG